MQMWLVLFVNILRKYIAIQENNRLSLFISTILSGVILTILIMHMVTNLTISKLVNSIKCNLFMIITICSLVRTTNLHWLQPV